MSATAQAPQPQTREYAVEGSWPFPLDMLRHDDAVAASTADASLIARLSGAHADAPEDLRDAVTINLVIKTFGNPRRLPNDARWRSFGWRVVGDQTIDGMRAHQKMAARVEELKASALAKLTPEERSALGLEDGQ